MATRMWRIRRVFGNPTTRRSNMIEIDSDLEFSSCRELSIDVGMEFVAVALSKY